MADLLVLVHFQTGSYLRVHRSARRSPPSRRRVSGEPVGACGRRGWFAAGFPSWLISKGATSRVRVHACLLTPVLQTRGAPPRGGSVSDRLYNPVESASTGPPAAPFIPSLPPHSCSSSPDKHWSRGSAPERTTSHVFLVTCGLLCALQFTSSPHPPAGLCGCLLTTLS